MKSKLIYPQEKTGNGKSLIDLVSTFPKFKGIYFCNEKESTPVNCVVKLEWDDINQCPGIYIDEFDSYINLPLPKEFGEDFALYYNTTKGKEDLEIVFNFLTKIG